MAVNKRLLTNKELEKRFKALTTWELNKKNTQLTKTFQTNTFIAGLAFVAKIAVHAEVLGHHPDIELSYNAVKVKLSTHDLKGLTRDDFELAKRIDNLTLR